MKNLVKSEYQRLFCNKAFYMALLINCIVIALQIISEIVPYALKDQFFIYPLSTFEKWIGGEARSIYPALYFLSAPLIASIPYGGTLYEDIQTGYVQNIVIKVNKMDYFMAKYIVTFSTAFISVIPLIINYLVVALLLPSLIPQVSTGFYTIRSMSELGEVFYTHPYIYCLLWLVLDFIFWGLMQTISLIVAMFCNNIYAAILAPFLVGLVVYVIAYSTRMYNVAPFVFLQPSQIIPANFSIVFVELFFLVILGGIYFLCGLKREIWVK